MGNTQPSLTWERGHTRAGHMQRMKPGVARSCCGFREAGAPGGGGLVHEGSSLSFSSFLPRVGLAYWYPEIPQPHCMYPPPPTGRSFWTLKLQRTKAFRNQVRKTVGDAFLKAQLTPVFIWIELEQPGETQRVCHCPVTPVPRVSR